MDAQFFDTAAGWRVWFSGHHDTAPELFVGYRKKIAELTGRGLMYPAGARVSNYARSTRSAGKHRR